jgi:DNA-binding NarL/FixJ family response regulator
MSEATPPAIRLIVADDHRLFREGVASLLERAADIQLVGQAATGEEALELVRELAPEVVLMDLQMPGLGGIAATRAIAQAHPAVGVIVLTMFEDDESVFAALRAGARGYVLKDADRGSLLRAIRAVAGGDALLGEAVARRVLQYFAVSAEVRPEAPTPPEAIDADQLASVQELTPREVEVLRLIGRGFHNREIAGRMVISEKTLSNHISNIFAKLQVTDRTQAALLAREAGLA